jgi:hypothetical protein
MKKLYHLYNENFEITHAEFFIEGEQPSNAIFVENVNFIKTMFNPETNEVFEGATKEEIEQANKIVVPESISQMKLRKQLILSGISISAIDALIQQLPQPNRDLIFTMWEYAVVFDRTNPELNAMAEMLGISQQQLDEIFINANKL